MNMANNPFKQKKSLFQHNSARALSSKPRQQPKMSNPFQRKILIPQSRSYSNKKQTKSKSLYSSRQHMEEKQNIFHNFDIYQDRKYLNSYSSISIIQEGFRKQKIIELERKYSEVFGFQTLRYQYDGGHKNKEYFNQKQSDNKQIKKNKIFSESCSTYSELGTKINKQKRENKEKNQGKTKIKKMLSWNIQNQNQLKQIRRNSQNQYSSCKSPNSNPTFGAIGDEVLDKTKIFLKKMSIQKVNLEEKQAISKDFQEDYVVQLTNSYKQENKLASSSSSFFSGLNCNNLKYGSNFQGIIYKKSSESHQNMDGKAIQNKIINSFPKNIEYLGKKFDLIRF